MFGRRMCGGRFFVTLSASCLGKGWKETALPDVFREAGNGWALQTFKAGERLWKMFANARNAARICQPARRRDNARNACCKWGWERKRSIRPAGHQRSRTGPQRLLNWPGISLNLKSLNCLDKEEWGSFTMPEKTEGLKGRAYLEMWCRFPGRGEFFSRGLNNVVSGTTDWIDCQTPFFLKEGEQPDLVRLNVVVEGPGKIWIRDVALSHAASR
jgi:hypothetical protein